MQDRKVTRAVRSVGAACAALLVAGASSTSSPELEARAFRVGVQTREQAPRVFDVTMARGVTSGQPVGAGDVFAPGTNPIYVWFRHEGIPAGTTITSRWYYLGASPPVAITEGTITAQPPQNWGQFNYELGQGKLWPSGPYRIDLLVGGALAAEARFTVASAAPVASPREEQPYIHPSAGFQLMAPAGWTLNDRLPHADLQMKPVQGEGLIEIVSAPTSIKLDPLSYAAGWESNAVGADKLLHIKRAGHPLQVDAGRAPAYTGVYEGDGVLAKVLFVGLPDRFYVLTAVFKTDDFAQGESLFDRLVQSFRAAVK